VRIETEGKKVNHAMIDLDDLIDSGIQILESAIQGYQEWARDLKNDLNTIGTLNITQLKTFVKEHKIFIKGISKYRKAELYESIKDDLERTLKYIPVSISRIKETITRLRDPENLEIMNAILKMKSLIDSEFKRTGKPITTIEPVDYSGDWKGKDLVEKLSKYIGSVVVLYGGSLMPQFRDSDFAYLYDIHEIQDPKSQFKARARVTTLEMTKHHEGKKFPKGLPLLTKKEPFIWSWKLDVLPDVFYKRIQKNGSENECKQNPKMKRPVKKIY
jgi:hypothetical protein